MDALNKVPGVGIWVIKNPTTGSIRLPKPGEESLAMPLRDVQISPGVDPLLLQSKTLPVSVGQKQRPKAKSKKRALNK
jgi:hypothetical protein